MEHLTEANHLSTSLLLFCTSPAMWNTPDGCTWDLLFSWVEAVSCSTASRGEDGLRCGFVSYLLAGRYTCSSNPGRPPLPGSAMQRLQRMHRSTRRFVGITATLLSEAPPPFMVLRSANPCLVQQAAISVWMEPAVEVLHERGRQTKTGREEEKRWRMI